MSARRLAALVAAALGLAASAAAVAVGTQPDGPGATASRFFHALADANAPRALGLAAQPTRGEYLTSAVLRQQQSVARISDVTVGRVDTTGPGRRVAQVRYLLTFATGSEPVSDEVQLVHHGRGWRLARVATDVSFRVTGAPGRIMLAGRPLPVSAQLFPGAPPVAADWSGIEVTNRPRLLLAHPTQTVTVEAAVNPAGQAELASAIEAGLRQCLQSTAARTACPSPSVSTGRPVPGALRGQLLATPNPAVSVQGSCQVWDYDNIASERSGDFTVAVTARASVSDPRSVVFGPPG